MILFPKGVGYGPDLLDELAKGIYPTPFVFLFWVIIIDLNAKKEIEI